MRHASLCALLILMSTAAFAQNGAIGPSTKTAPYLKPLAAGVSFTSLLTAGDQVGQKPDGAPWRMVGAPDGLGAFDNGDGTITVLIDHELRPNAGVKRAHGAPGAFVSRLVVDKASLRVTGASDLIETVKGYNPATKQYETSTAPLGALCSGDLPGGSAFYDPESRVGYDGQIFLSGEELPDGRPFAHFATGEAAGTSYELAWLGNMAFENVVAHPGAGRRTIVAMMDDSHPLGQVYFYVGEKRASGDPVEKAGLAHGRLYGLKVASMPIEPANKDPESAARFTLVEMGDAGDVSALSAKDIDALSEAQGVTEFQRPEDGAWDRLDPNRFYFNATADFNLPSRLWAVRFDDISHPEQGGTLRALLNGSEVPEGSREKYHMLDNIAVAADGQLILQEDPGNTPYLAHILQFDPKTSKLAALAEFDGDLFKEGALGADEESSGVIDVTPLLGSARQRAFLLTVQAHFDLEPKGEIVQGGQLVLMRQDIP
jgi:serralysin